MKGSQSVRFGGTPAKLVQDAKRDLNAPLIPNANMALKNFGAFELQRFIDKRLTTLNASTNRGKSVQAHNNDSMVDE